MQVNRAEMSDVFYCYLRNLCDTYARTQILGCRQLEVKLAQEIALRFHLILRESSPTSEQIPTTQLFPWLPSYMPILENVDMV